MASVSSTHDASSMSIRDEGPTRARIAHEALEQRAAELEVELQPETRQLDGDVGVEAVRVDRRERLAVGCRDRLGLGGGVHLLTEHVNRGPLSGCIERDDRAPCIFERRACDVGSRNSPDERSWDGGESGGNGAIEDTQGDASVPRFRSERMRHMALGTR